MATFDLTDGEIAQLKAKFKDFQDARNAVLMFLVSYIADYQKFRGTSSARRIYLRKKYASQPPRLNYPICGEDGFYWSVYNISVILGRNRSSITRTLVKMRRVEENHARLNALCKTVKLGNGLPIRVYHQDIFDMILDQYEDEYLMRFANPRHGKPNHAPDIQELRRFWEYLKSRESIQKWVFTQQELSDISRKGWRDVLRQMRQRAFTFFANVGSGLRHFILRFKR